MFLKSIYSISVLYFLEAEAGVESLDRFTASDFTHGSREVFIDYAIFPWSAFVRAIRVSVCWVSDRVDDAHHKVVVLVDFVGRRHILCVTYQKYMSFNFRKIRRHTNPLRYDQAKLRSSL